MQFLHPNEVLMIRININLWFFTSLHIELKEILCFERLKKLNTGEPLNIFWRNSSEYKNLIKTPSYMSNCLIRTQKNLLKYFVVSFFIADCYQTFIAHSFKLLSITNYSTSKRKYGKNARIIQMLLINLDKIVEFQWILFNMMFLLLFFTQEKCCTCKFFPLSLFLLCYLTIYCFWEKYFPFLIVQHFF